MGYKAITYILGAFFIIAGSNHFVNPEFYLPLIPPYIPFPSVVNSVSGILEILLGAGLFLPKWRTFSAWGIIVLLWLFIPSHVYFIQIGSCIPEGLCVPPWVGWLRLIIIHPLLIIWAYAVSLKIKKNG